MDIPDEMLRPLKQKNRQDNYHCARIIHSHTVWGRFKTNKSALISLYVLLLIILASIIGPMLSPYSYSAQIMGDEGLQPCLKHPLGTDTLGRDLLVRVLYGARISLSVGIAASIVNLAIGVLYGGISGYFGGKTDSIMMRIVDVLYSIPLMLYVILLMVVFKESAYNLFKLKFLSMFKDIGPALLSIYAAIGLTYWIDTSRIVRAQVLTLKQQEFVTALKALGAGDTRILFRHIIPNCAGPVIAVVALQIPNAIFTETFLSFIGLGVDAPMASLGTLAADALGGIRSYFYLILIPSFAISVIILAFNLLGDGLQEALSRDTVS